MQTKLFIGTRVTPDLKGRLGEIFPMPGWQLIPFADKEYIGLYLDSPQPTVATLQQQTKKLTDLLQEHLPDVRTDNLPIVVFPQTFLG